MRFAAATLLAFASSVVAQTAGFDPISKPAKGEAVPAGKTYEVEWEASKTFTGAVTLTLLGGKTPDTLQDVQVIAKGVENDGTYDWAVDSSLGADATYGIRISLDSNTTIFQYSFPFSISGGASGSSTGSGSVTVTTSSATGSGTVTSGTVTVSANTTSSEGPSTVTSVTLISSTGPSSNLSTTSTGPDRTTVVNTVTPSTTRTGSPTATIQPGAGASSGVERVALFGGLAMALFAL